MAICREAIDEYKHFLIKYLLPLLGIPHKSEELITIDQETEYMGSSVVYIHNTIYFSTDKDTVFKIINADLTEDNKKLAINIIQSFFKVSKYRMTSIEVVYNHSYYSDIQRDANYKMAIQKGICNWIVGAKNEAVEKLFDLLEKWSVQTYEGRKVTFGFIINPDETSNFSDKYGDWCAFLNDDFSAVLTDCIDSAIELDAQCDFVRYISLTDTTLLKQSDDYRLDDTLPFRFSEIIKRHVTNKCVGIFLLNNGDIIISKDRVIRFVKRNLKWLNFNYDAFNNSIHNFCKSLNVDKMLVQSIFASVLDVSFAHTGGIISVVEDISKLLDCGQDGYPILNSCDYLLTQKTTDQIEDEISAAQKNASTNPEFLDKEIRKRMLKRKVIKTLVGEKTFENLDRKLRCELISMDGACILDTSGNVCSFGAIIKNDSGSSGGGRGAAAKKLSNYGFAIKISTDGYIELFVNGEPTYAIK